MGETEMGVKTHTKVVTLGINDYFEYRAARKWCIERFGPGTKPGVKDYERPWYAYRCWTTVRLPLDNQGIIKCHAVCVSAWHFRDAAHATMFRLVWAEKIRYA